MIDCGQCKEWEKEILTRGYCKKFKRQSMQWESCNEVDFEVE